MTAAIGMSAGAGMHAGAVAATIMVIVCLELMDFLHNHVFKNNRQEEKDEEDSN